jgi:hypothetical protein
LLQCLQPVKRSRRRLTRDDNFIRAHGEHITLSIQIGRRAHVRAFERGLNGRNGKRADEDRAALAATLADGERESARRRAHIVRKILRRETVVCRARVGEREAHVARQAKRFLLDRQLSRLRDHLHGLCGGCLRAGGGDEQQERNAEQGQKAGGARRESPC